MKPITYIKKMFSSILHGAVFVILTVLMTIVVVGCGGELPSSAEIVCESFVECTETNMTIEECMDQRLVDINANFQKSDSLKKMKLSDIDRGENWNRCMIEQKECDYNSESNCDQFDEFDWEYYWNN